MRSRKYSKSRQPKRIWLVICEGETEEAYVRLLGREYRLPIVIKTKVLGNRVNQRLVSQWMDELGVDKDDVMVFYVYDADVAPVREKIRTLPGKALISNPCFELWMTLHHKKVTRTLTSEMMVKELSRCHPVWEDYMKGKLSTEQAKQLMANRRLASSRAQELIWPENPSSNVYELIDLLDREKMVK